MNYQILAYSIYLILSIALVIWVAHTLFKNGRVFLIEIFAKDQNLADSVNKLLIVGFYLINIGYAVFALKIGDNVIDPRMLIEKLSVKLGLIILILGAMHFFNLTVLFSLRRKAKEGAC
ncbi:MAG: hypothetical protein AAFX87_09720 [Bacteroidota bacterium]